MVIDNYNICWYMTEACHLNCPFCFAFKDNQHPTYDVMRSIGGTLVEQGIKTLTLVGGEPLLNKDIYKIIDEFSEKIDIKLVTSASIKNIQKLVEVTDKLKKLSISIDTTNLVSSKILRGENYEIDLVLRNLKTLSKLNARLQINTVVCSKNIQELDDIAKFINDLGVDVTWKLFQLTLNNNNTNLPSCWEIGDREFLKTSKDVKNKNPFIEVDYYMAARFKYKYILIKTNGDICLPGIKSSEPIGSIFIGNIKEIISPYMFDYIA